MRHGVKPVTSCRGLACRWLAAAVLTAGALALPAFARDRFIVMASTTSTEQSGLFAQLLPAFERSRGIKVRVVAVGTGQALEMGRRGDADVLFVHDTAAETRFVAEGFGLSRRAVMHNDFVLIGPAGDPAGVKGHDIAAAMARLAASNTTFVSRADKSGTHAAELRAWALAGFGEPALRTDAKKPGLGGGTALEYRACGCGMGAALNIASSLDAYLLADRGSWLAFKNRSHLAVLVEGDRRMFNPYGVIVVNPAKHPHTKTALAQAFSDWVVSRDGQATIAAYRVGGEQLFFPSAAEH